MLALLASAVNWGFDTNSAYQIQLRLQTNPLFELPYRQLSHPQVLPPMDNRQIRKPIINTKNPIIKIVSKILIIPAF